MPISTPHIALGTTLKDAISVLERLGDVSRGNDREEFYRVDSDGFSVAVYPDGDRVKAVWYSDSHGRGSTESVKSKVQQYLERYGSIENWELRMDNGWMHYWFNPASGAAMVYGIHNDVIRFNEYQEDT